MPSSRQRLKFDAEVKGLWADGKTEEEIAEILNVKVEKVCDARRRLGIFKVGHFDKSDKPMKTKKERKPQSKMCVIKGKIYWDVSEFFGIWEYNN